MDRYVSNFLNRLDAKGRVSIPASFRAVLARDGHDGLFVHPSLTGPTLDCGGRELIGEIERLILRLPIGSEERDQLSLATFGASEVLKLDGEGRIVVSELIRTHAEIRDSVAFVGLGPKFQLWEPERFRARLAAARERAREAKVLAETGARTA